MHFLVVDDSSTMRRILCNTINSIGHTTTAAEDGLDALEKIKEQKFVVIMTDWNMPRMDGLHLVRALRAMEEYKRTPIIMVTTEGGKQEVITAIKEGVSNYIVKPFTAFLLREKLKEIVL